MSTYTQIFNKCMAITLDDGVRMASYLNINENIANTIIKFYTNSYILHKNIAKEESIAEIVRLGINLTIGKKFIDHYDSIFEYEVEKCDIRDDIYDE